MNKRQIHKAQERLEPVIEEQAQEAPALASSGRGGKRPGAGRKKGKKIKPDFEIKKSRSIRMTDAEYPQVLEFLKQLRKANKAIKERAKADYNQDINQEAEDYIEVKSKTPDKYLQAMSEILEEQSHKPLRTLDEAFAEYQERQKKPQ